MGGGGGITGSGCKTDVDSSAIDSWDDVPTEAVVVRTEGTVSVAVSALERETVAL